MQNASLIADDWPQLRAQLPAGFDVEQTARACGAFTRARGVRDADALLRLALGYGACGMSLRQGASWAGIAGIAQLCNVSLLTRLAKAAPWLGELLRALLADRVELPGGRWAGHRLRAVDATTICEPGADRTTWRLHVGYDLADGQVDQLELSDVHGAESLRRFTWQPGDIALADRGYARPRDLRPVLEAGADVIVRTGWRSLRLLHWDGSPFDLFAALRAKRQSQWEVRVGIDEGTARAEPLPLRLVIRRKRRGEARAAQRRLLQDARKRGKRPDPNSLQAAKYILLLTSLPTHSFPTRAVLAIYRLRWQIELAFKRLKSLADLDTLPAKKPELARTWICARLIVALLAERIAGNPPDSSPCAPRHRRRPAALAVGQDRARHLAQRGSRHARRHGTSPKHATPVQLAP